MIEIRIHGRGGQGAVIASQILAQATFRDDMHVQAFPAFGSERRGAPVTAFFRLDVSRSGCARKFIGRTGSLFSMRASLA